MLLVCKDLTAFCSGLEAAVLMRECRGWLQGYFYYIFGFCFVVGALTVIITIEVAIVTTYVQLCAEDYQWW